MRKYTNPQNARQSGNSGGAAAHNRKAVCAQPSPRSSTTALGYIISHAMNIADPATEWLRLSEHYRQLTDDELIALARKRSELTDVAQQTIRDEASSRRLTIPPEEPEEEEKEQRPEFVPEPPDSAYAEERSLVTICTVWSVGNALRIQFLLDRAGIPFYMGKEKATGVDLVTSNFADGVEVQIMSVGWIWARDAMKDYFPKDEPESEKKPETPPDSICCPRCRSEEIVLLHTPDEDPATHQQIAQKYEWKCDACGYEWQDNGVINK